MAAVTLTGAATAVIMMIAMEAAAMIAVTTKLMRFTRVMPPLLS